MDEVIGSVIATKEDLSSCRALSDVKFKEVINNLDAYHTKMDGYINRLVVATNGKRVERAPDDLLVEIWETIQLLRDMKRLVEIFKRYKKAFITIGIIIVGIWSKWQIADFISLLSKYHLIK